MVYSKIENCHNIDEIEHPAVREVLRYALFRQVSALGKPGDLLIAISTSGTSANVIRAVETAGQANMRTIALTGSGGRLGEICSISIPVPSTDTQHIQESHLAIAHVLCYLVERCLFGDEEITSDQHS